MDNDMFSEKNSESAQVTDNVKGDADVIDRSSGLLGILAAGVATVYFLMRLFYGNAVTRHLEQYGIRLTGVGISMSGDISLWVICSIIVFLLVIALRFLLKKIGNKWVFYLVLSATAVPLILFIRNHRQSSHLLTIDQFIITQSKTIAMLSMCLLCFLLFFGYRFISGYLRKHQTDIKSVLITAVCFFAIIFLWYYPSMDNCSDLNYVKKFELENESYFILFEDSIYYYAMQADEQPADSSAVLNRNRQCIVEKTGIPFSFVQYSEIRF